MAEERDSETEEFLTLKVSWPWPWPWIRLHHTLLCSIHQTSPTHQTAFKGQITRTFCGQINLWTPVQLYSINSVKEST